MNGCAAELCGRETSKLYCEQHRYMGGEDCRIHQVFDQVGPKHACRVCGTVFVRES